MEYVRGFWGNVRTKKWFDSLTEAEQVYFLTGN